MRLRASAVTVAAISITILTSIPRLLWSQIPKDPCAEATQAQVSSALGTPVNAGQPINSLNTTCLWSATSSSRVRLTVQFMVADTYDRIKSGQLPGVERSPIAGLGDDAFAQTTSLGDNGSKLTMLYARKGKTMVVVRVYGVADQAKQLAAEKAVAQAVVSKI